MPSIGNKYLLFNTINKTTGKYEAFPTGQTKPLVLGKLVSAAVTPEYEEAEFYADDVLQESEYGFVKGEGTFEIGDIEDASYADIFGADLDSDGVVTEGVSDAGKEFGLAYVVEFMKGHKRYYRAIQVFRNQAKSFEQSTTTKGANTEFTAATLTTKVLPIDGTLNGVGDGKWRRHKDFTVGTSILTDAAALTAAKEQCETWLTPSV